MLLRWLARLLFRKDPAPVRSATNGIPSARSSHLGNDDLYITFRRKGHWTEPRNPERAVNWFANEYGATVRPQWDAPVVYE